MPSSSMVPFTTRWVLSSQLLETCHALPSSTSWTLTWLSVQEWTTTPTLTHPPCLTSTTCSWTATPMWTCTSRPTRSSGRSLQVNSSVLWFASLWIPAQTCTGIMLPLPLRLLPLSLGVLMMFTCTVTSLCAYMEEVSPG